MGAAMDTKIEISRLVSTLRSLLRGEIDRCEQAVGAGDLDAARKELIGIHERVVRAIYILNRLR